MRGMGEPLAPSSPSSSPPPAASTDPMPPLLALCVASLCEMVAAAVLCASGTCDGLEAYAVSAGCVSIAACLPLLLLHLDFFNVGGTAAAQYAPHLAVFLLLWWCAACFALTFVSPFAGLCNGFFASWVAPVAALLLCRATSPAVAAALGRAVAAARGAGAEGSILCLLCATSAVVWIEAAVALGQASESHAAVKVWALCVGVVSMAACAAYLALEQAAGYGYTLAIGLGVWWLQGVAISFVPSVFNGAVNGFVCTWLSVGLAGYYCSICRNPRRLDPVASSDPETHYSSMAPPGMPGSAYCGSAFEGFGSGSSDPVPSMGIPSMKMPSMGSLSPSMGAHAPAEPCLSPGPVSVATPPPQRPDY